MPVILKPAFCVKLHYWRQLSLSEKAILCLNMFKHKFLFMVLCVFKPIFSKGANIFVVNCNTRQCNSHQLSCKNSAFVGLKWWKHQLSLTDEAQSERRLNSHINLLSTWNWTKPQVNQMQREMATLYQLGVLLLFLGKSQKNKLQNVYLLYMYRSI